MLAAGLQKNVPDPEMLILSDPGHFCIITISPKATCYCLRKA